MTARHRARKHHKGCSKICQFIYSGRQSLWCWRCNCPPKPWASFTNTITRHPRFTLLTSFHLEQQLLQQIFSWDGSRAKRDLSPKLHFSKQQHRVVFVFCFLSVWFHAGLFKEAGVPVKQGLLLPRLCNQDSNRLWEQAAACNYFPTDKRLMGIYCPYWIFCASLSKLQASHPWLTLSSPCASQTFPGLGSQLTGRADPGLGVSTTKHQLWGSQGLGEEITCAVVSAWCWIPKNAAANTWLWG